MKLANEVTVCAGQRGSGKSYITSWVANEWNALGIQFFYLDSANANRLQPGVKHITINAGNKKNKIPIWRENVIFHYGLPPNEQGREMWNEFINRLLDHVKKLRHDYSKCIILDEAHLAVPRNGETACKRNIKYAVTSLRSWGIGWWFDTQRFSEMDTTIHNEANNVIVFRMTGRNDLEALKQWSGYIGQEQTPETISNMGTGEHVILRGSV